MQISYLRWNRHGAWDAPTPPHADAQLVLYFGDTDLLAGGKPFEALRRQFPDAVVAGCSAGSVIGGADVLDAEAVAVAVCFAHTTVRACAYPIGDAARSLECGARLGEALAGPGLAGVLVLSDGLLVNGSELVRGLEASLGASVPIAGGLAGDGARFGRTVVGVDAVPADGTIAVVGLYGGALRIAQSAAGGWDAFGPPRRVTRSERNVLYELDGRPALELYERYLGDEAAGLPGTALLYPLRIWQDASPDHDLVRTVLAIDRANKTMTFAGDVPTGWSAQLMRGVQGRLVAGAALAARQACERVSGRPDGTRLALLVSCVGRRLLMGQRTAEEVEAVDEALGAGTTAVGFYSYGELGRRGTVGRCELHNQTMTVTVLEEAA